MFCMPDVYIHIKCKTQAQPNHSSKLHHKSIFELCARIYRTDVQCSKWICCMLLVRFSHVQWTNVYNAPISMDYRQHQHLPNNNYRSFIATGSHISDIVLKGLSAFANWALIDEHKNASKFDSRLSYQMEPYSDSGGFSLQRWQKWGSTIDIWSSSVKEEKQTNFKES